MGRRARSAEVVTIYWRDIPAQVNGQHGRERHQVLLSEKFQRAVDRAKRKAQIRTAADDISQWRREAAACDGDVVAAAQAVASDLESHYSVEFLGRLAFAGGFAADLTDGRVDHARLRDLEELEPAAESVGDLLDEPVNEGVET